LYRKRNVQVVYPLFYANNSIAHSYKCTKALKLANESRYRLRLRSKTSNFVYH